MYDLSLHILDIVENSIDAHASKIDISILEDKREDMLEVEIKDDGRGINSDDMKKVLDPFFTTKAGKSIGLGLPLLAQAARESDGDLKISSGVNKGTKIKASFRLSHIDRKPLGNMEETIRVLTAAHPEVEFNYKHEVNS